MRSGIERWEAVAIILGAALLFAQPAPARPGVDWSRASTIDIVMPDYRFVPDHLELRRGAAYRLRFINRSKTEWHEFTAGRFLHSVVLGNPKALDAVHSELAVAPGAVRELEVVPLRAGRYRFYCSDHDWAGMEGEITVK